MTVAPAGSFPMGAPSPNGSPSPDRENHKKNERPIRNVRIAQPFAVGVYEVTVAEFGRFVDETGHSTGSFCRTFAAGEWGSIWNPKDGLTWRNAFLGQNGSHPVACVSWDDARAYADWLSRRTGKRYRLLSEAEWEYAARAGTSSWRYWGDDESDQCAYANGADQSAHREYPGWSWSMASCDDGHARAAPVGSYRANPWGLHDVLGNVWEWVQDCNQQSYQGAPVDGSAWEHGDCSRRGLRGGSWGSSPWYLRSVDRNQVGTGNRNVISGFRVARTLAP